MCIGCQAQDCGKCSHCRDMVKFGEAGKKKQACSYPAQMYLDLHKISCVQNETFHIKLIISTCVDFY